MVIPFESRNESGEFHCDSGPAIISADGTQQWCLNGQRHREDGPAYISAHGDQGW